MTERAPVLLTLGKQLGQPLLRLGVFLALLSGCDSSNSLPGADSLESKVSGSIKGSFLVSSIKPLAIGPGETVTVEGFGLSGGLEVLIDDQPVPITGSPDDRKLSFRMPAGTPGLLLVAIRKRDETSTNMLVRLATDGSPVLVGGNLRQICKGDRYFSLTGDAIEGQRDCATPPPLCTSEAEIDCLAHEAFPVTDKQSLAERVVAGKTVAGVAGQVSAEMLLPTCAADGAVDCISNDLFPVIDKNALSPLDLAAGVTLAGVRGELSLPDPRDVRSGIAYGGRNLLQGSLDVSPPSVRLCARDGESNCYASAPDFLAAATANVLADKILLGTSIAGVAGMAVAAPPPCGLDGQIDCVAVTNFPAVDKINKLLPGSKILSGHTIAGIAGNVTLPAASHVWSGSGSFGDPGAAVTPTLTLPTAANVLAANGAFGVGGNGSTPTLTLPDAAKVHISNGAFGVGGNNSTPTLTLPDAAKVHIASGAFGVGGNNSTPTLTLPDAAKVHTSNGAFGIGGNGSTPTLTLPDAAKVHTSNGAFGVAGNSSTPSLSLPDAADVFSGVSYGVGGAGTTGLLTLASDANVRMSQGAFGRGGNSVTPTLADCATDGAVDCVAVTAYKAANMAHVTPANIKSGVTIAAVVGAYPSAAHPLPNASDTNDLPSLTAATAAGNYEWWNAAGTRYTGIIADAGTITPTSSPKIYEASVYRRFIVNGDTDLVPSNIRSDVNLFNVIGTATPSPPDCAGDGSTGCVVKSPMAAVVTTGLASKVLSGNTIAGMVGNVTLPAVGKVLTGTQFGVPGTSVSTGTLTLPAAGHVWSGSGSFGDPGAAVTPTLTLPTGAHVLAANGVFGVGGNSSTPTLTLPDAAKVHQSNGTFGVGGNGSTPSLTLPNPADVYTGISYGIGGTGVTGSLTLALDANVRASQGPFGRDGNSVTPSLANCAADGAVDCVAVTEYKAAKMANVTPGNIKSGVTIAAVVGAYPSASHRLANASDTTDLTSLAATTAAGSYEWWDASGARYTGSIADAGTITPSTSDKNFDVSLYRMFTVAGSANLTSANIKNGTAIFGVTGAYPSSTNLLTGADNTADLDFATFDAKIKSSASFEWFDAAGNRYTNTGDTDIATGNIANGISIFSTAGTLAGGSFCSDDGQIGCVTTSRYKSMDTDASVISAWDIRKGKTVGGLAGEIVFYKNMANTKTFNRTSGTSAADGVDLYDTIDDYNSNGAFPNQNPKGWDQATGANWLRDSVSDDGSGSSGIANDGLCNGGETCVYIDRISGLRWLRDNGSDRTWENGISYCENSANGGYSDWRLPTQKELQQAYINGIWSLKAATMLNLSSAYYWSASTRSWNQPSAWAFRLDYGDTDDGFNKTNKNLPVLCVR